MFARRRPLLRAAVVGGGAYAIGKRSGQRGAQDTASESGQNTSGNVQQAPAAPTGTGGESVSDQLAQLSQMHQQGSLSDSEFAAAKSRLLGS